MSTRLAVPTSPRMLRLVPWLVACAALAVVPLAAPSCSAGGDGDGTGGSAGSGVGGLDLDGGSGASGGGFDKDASCAIASDEATKVPVTLLIMFDKSGSMLGPPWTQTTLALQDFFMDPASAGLSVGIRFFPDDGCDEPACDAVPCSQPKVEPAPLTDLSAPTDVQEQALLDAFIDESPAGGTPMSAALQGALIWASNHVSAHPLEKVAVVLVTDGEPEDCNTDTTYITGLASDAYNQSGVLTFAIGLEGSSETLMDHLASAGGTGSGVFIGAGNAQEELVAALNGIRDTTVACEYVLPTEVDGHPVIPSQVNVFYSAGGTGEAVAIGQVPNAGACTTDKGGWYYDDPASPTRILFCDSTCTGLRSDENAVVEILVGCTTIPA